MNTTVITIGVLKFFWKSLFSLDIQLKDTHSYL